MRTARLSRKQSGFTLVEIMVVVGIVGLLATIAICNIMVARDNSRIRVIQRNLTQIESAKSLWALDNRKYEGDAVADVTVISDYLKGGTVAAVAMPTRPARRWSCASFAMPARW